MERMGEMKKKGCETRNEREKQPDRDRKTMEPHKYDDNRDDTTTVTCHLFLFTVPGKTYRIWHHIKLN